MTRDAPSGKNPAGETILLVDDQKNILQLARLILETAGYKVIPASSGPEAVAEWKEHGREVALLLTDITMPGGMSGIALAERLRAERPELKVVFVSGYSSELHRVKEEPGTAFLQKPYDASSLQAAVRKILNQP